MQCLHFVSAVESEDANIALLLPGIPLMRSECDLLESPVPCRSLAPLFCLLLVVSGASHAAEELALPVPASGFNPLITNPLGNPEVTTGDSGRADMLQLMADCSLYFDTNMGLSPDSDGLHPEGGMVGVIHPAITWQRESAGLKSSLNVEGGYNQYFENSEYSGGNYAIDGEVQYNGGKWDLAANLNQGFTEGVNRYYGAAVSQYHYGFDGRFDLRLSPKTDLDASWNSSWWEPDGGYGSTESHSMSLSTMWRYSPLLRIGPGVRISNAGGDFQDERDSLGPMLSVQYRLSHKIALNGRVALDFVRYSSGADDQFLSAAIGADYAASRLWHVNFSVLRDVVADGSVGGGFRETTGFDLGVSRILRDMTFEFSMGYEHSGFSEVAGGVRRDPADYATLKTSLVIPVLGKRASVVPFVHWQDSASDDLSNDWSGIQAGCTWTCNF